jgi:hypothetical protein
VPENPPGYGVEVNQGGGNVDNGSDSSSSGESDSESESSGADDGIPQGISHLQGNKYYRCMAEYQESNNGELHI